MHLRRNGSAEMSEPEGLQPLDWIARAHAAVNHRKSQRVVSTLEKRLATEPQGETEGATNE